MCAIVRAGLEAGALGFSTGRTAGHRDVRGNPVPGTFAPEDELAALLGAHGRRRGRRVRGRARRASAVRSPATPPAPWSTSSSGWSGWARRTGRPITFLVMERPEVDHWRPWFEAARQANARGAHLRPQVGNRCFGVLMGHQSKLNPFQYRPTYRDHLAHLPLPERVRRMRDPEVRARILAEEPDFSGPFLMDQIGRRALDHVFALGDAPRLRADGRHEHPGRRRAPGVDPWEVAYDVMLEADGHELLLWPLLNYGGDSYDGLLAMMEDPITVQGLGDAGAHVGPGVRRQHEHLHAHPLGARPDPGPEAAPSSAAVRRLTSDPAELYGLGDRGVLAPGPQGRPQRDRPRRVCASSGPSRCTTCPVAPVG